MKILREGIGFKYIFSWFLNLRIITTVIIYFDLDPYKMDVKTTFQNNHLQFSLIITLIIDLHYIRIVGNLLRDVIGAKEPETSLGRMRFL